MGFRNGETEELVTRLKRRGASLYHACQFIDFVSYLALGGIPTRAQLVDNSLPFTPFETDEMDRQNDVWDKVFANLVDFGEAFAGGRSATPNVYGPIMLKITPEALLVASEVMICLESAGAPTFDQTRDCLTDIEDVERLFALGYNPKSQIFERQRLPWLKFRQKIAAEFGRMHVSGPDVCCSFPGGRLPKQYIVSAIVDPYVVSGKQLYDMVEFAAERMDAGFPVWRRGSFKDGRGDLYAELSELLIPEQPDVQAALTAGTGSSTLAAWWRSIREDREQRESLMPRYAKYLRGGTLLPMLAGG